MTYEMTKKCAIDDVTNYTGDDGCYVIFKRDYTIFYGTNEDLHYDYEVFSSYEDLQKYLNGKVTYNFLDSTTYMADDEKIIEAYHKHKIIILQENKIMTRWKKEIRKRGIKLECDYPYLPFDNYGKQHVSLEGVSVYIVNETLYPYIRIVEHYDVGDYIRHFNSNFEEFYTDFD